MIFRLLCWALHYTIYTNKYFTILNLKGKFVDSFTLNLFLKIKLQKLNDEENRVGYYNISSTHKISFIKIIFEKIFFL